MTDIKLKTPKSKQSKTCNKLETLLFGVPLLNPIGLAAGCDKNGKLVPKLANYGFGFAEIGSVSAKPWAGNSNPRLFRLPQDQALINRVGLSGQGADRVSHRLAKLKFSVPIAINIAKTNDPCIRDDDAVEDILYTFRAIKDLPLLYVTINVSCPNTKEGFLKEKQHISNILEEVQKLNSKRIPVLVKVSVDSPDQLIYDLVEVATTFSLSGYVCGNTTITRDGLSTDLKRVKAIGAGALSGRPLKPLALKLCKKIYDIKEKKQIIIGVGGITSGNDVYEFLAAGATVIQLYSGLIYHGMDLPKQICKEMLAN